MKYFLFIVTILSMTVMSLGQLKLHHEWKYVDFIWESPHQRQQAIDSGNYNASLIFLYDLDRAPDGRRFVTAIRDKGVPVSVTTITWEKGEGGPLLRPYPDWSWYKDDCKGITGGVYKLEIKCNHLFLVDTGRIGEDQICPAQLLIFDLSTDKLVKRVIIPRNVAYDKNGIGLLASVAVHASPNCENIKDTATVFMTDTEGYGLVVYNAKTSKLCRIESDFMIPTDVGFVIEGQSFIMADGIFSLTLINEDLYYTALPGSKIYKMNISKLAECSLSDSEANEITQLVGTLSDQTASLASEECVIFFSNIPKTSIMCADATKEINFYNTALIAQDSETLQFPSALKSKNGELLILTNRYQRQLTNTLNINEINFRILTVDMEDIQKEFNCFASCIYDDYQPINRFQSLTSSLRIF